MIADPPDDDWEPQQWPPPLGHDDNPRSGKTATNGTTPNGSPYSDYRDKAIAFDLWKPEAIWAPLEPPDYLVDGVLIRGSLTMIAAYGSSLKTWVLEDLALAVSTGEKWLMRFATKPGRAMVIDFESGDYEIRRRAHLLAAARGYETPIDGFTFVSMPALSLVDDEFFSRVAILATQFAMIGIDSLSAGSGGLDENHPLFAKSLNKLKAIAARTKCVIVVLHHTKKGGKASDKGEVDVREMIRGTSAIFNACDVVLYMSRKTDTEPFIVRAIKTRGAKSADPFVVTIEDMSASATRVFAEDVPIDEEAEAEASELVEKCKREILVLLATTHDLDSANKVYSAIHGRRQSKIRALKEHRGSGLVVVHDRGCFRLASDVR